MRIRLVVGGAVDGSRSEFWKYVEDAAAVPRIGEIIDLGVRTGASSPLNDRPVTSVSWSASLDLAKVELVDLHDGWLQAHRQAFSETGWFAAMTGGS